MNQEKPGFLCICCEFKGVPFLESIARRGYPTFLITSESKKDEDWPFDSLADIFYMPGSDGRTWNLADLRKGTAHLMRNTRIGRIIALDDYDVHKAAYLREEFRMPGMGQTTARYFFDKLAMRLQARDADIPVPDFSSLFNDAGIHAFFERSTGPWLAKPRSDAGTLGIRKIDSEAAFREFAGEHRDDLHNYLIEEFKDGDIYHVDSLSFGGRVLFTRNSKYVDPPFEIAHGGGIFQSHTLDLDGRQSTDLRRLNEQVLKSFGMLHGASHSEYIYHNGAFYFLETSARVGGANLASMVEAASGINLWTEWAAIEDALLTNSQYQAPKGQNMHAGIITSLSRFEKVDYAAFSDPEIWWTLPKKYHVGLIFQSPVQERILELLHKYSHLIRQEFHATVPLKE